MNNYPPYWNDTITLFSRLKGSDSVTRLDVWKKTVLTGCYFHNVIQRDISGTNAAVGASVVCRIPASPDYKPYSQWKNDISDGFAVSVGDYIFRGTIDDDVNSENIVRIYNERKPGAMLIRAFSDNGSFMGLSEHYRIEGV